jgi:hypothetical protein
MVEQCVVEGSLVDHRAARRIDDHRVGFIAAARRRADQAARSRARQRTGEDDEIRLAERCMQAIETDDLLDVGVGLVARCG